MALDLTKPVTTRDGRKVRILCADAPGKWPIIGLMGDDGYPATWTLDGNYSLTSCPDMAKADLINVPEERFVVLKTFGGYDPPKTMAIRYLANSIAEARGIAVTEELGGEVEGIYRLVPA